jgi:hypothetical protein
MGLSAVTLLGALAVIVGFTCQNIFIVFWLEASSVGAYAVLLLCGLVFSAVFAAAALAFALATGDWSVFSVSDDAHESRLLVSPFRPGGVRLSHAQALAASGFCNALNGILIVYASPARRTPPLIQAVLQNCGVLFSVPFSKAVLGDRKRYAAAEPLRAAGVVVAAVVVAVLPTVLSVARGDTPAGLGGAGALAWIAVYVAGLAPNAMLNVLQQLYFLRTGLLREGATAHEVRRGTLRALMFANFMQPITYLALFWVDVLPWFGTSAGLADWARVTARGLACSAGAGAAGGVSAADCPPATPAWAWAFIAAYVLAYVGGAALNKESATFNMLCLVVVTTATALIWEVPRVNPNPSNTPLWSVLVSLSLSLAGSALWKRWEGRTPASEQFAVLDDERGGVRAATFDGDSFFGGGGESDDERALLESFDGDAGRAHVQGR